MVGHTPVKSGEAAQDRRSARSLPTMRLTVRARGLSSALVLALSLGTLLVGPAAAAAAPYSAPLSTAVRQLVVAPESTAPYDRTAQFGDWVDADGDCRNTRHEVLAAESTVAPTSGSGGCTVTAGRWTPSYDGGTYTAATQLEIDHLVPVSEAWDSGAQAWTQQQRSAFSNDLGDDRSLVAISSAVNQSKGDKGPEQWLPPADVCGYVTAWTAVKLRWSLTVDPAERAALVQRADACPGRTVTVETVGVPGPSTPPTSPPPAPGAIAIAASARTVDHGGATDLTVAGGVAGQVVDLYAASTRSPYRVIRTATSGGGGASTSWRLQPGETTRLYAQVRGGGRSDTLTITVRRTVTIGIRQAAGVHTFTGRVGRPVAGLQITLARLLTSGRVVGVASTTTGADGAYTIRTRLAPGLGGYYALTAPTADLQAGRSRLYGLVVPGPRAAAPAPVRAPAVPTPPTRPADVDCSDFATQAAAQAFHDRWFPYYGDFARLDGSDDDGRACESLP